MTNSFLVARSMLFFKIHFFGYETAILLLLNNFRKLLFCLFASFIAEIKKKSSILLHWKMTSSVLCFK